MTRSHILFLLIIAGLAVNAGHPSSGAPEQREADAEAARADEDYLRASKVDLDDAQLLEFFRQRVLTSADQQEMARLIRQLGSERFIEREQAVAALVRRGRPALPALREALKDPDLEIVRRAERCITDIEEGPGPALPMAAVRVLARRRPAGAVEVLVRYLPFADDEGIEEEVLTALVALAKGRDRVDPALRAALADGHPLRRAAAGFVLGRHGDVKLREAVRPLLADADARVRLRAAQGLLAGRDKAAVTPLIDLLADAKAGVAWRAEEILHQLAGEKAPPPPDVAGNADARARWRES
jgi:HEAT repeat protein